MYMKKGAERVVLPVRCYGLYYIARRVYCDYYFFFFEEEDGIRDVAVTGVQTCALPILALEAALVKRAEHRASFAALFDVYFASRRTAAPQSGGASPSLADLTGETAGEAASQELLQALLDALRRNDEGALRAIAALAVQQFGGINETRVGSQHYHLYRVLRHLDLSNLLQRVIEAAGAGGNDATLLDDRPFRDEQRHRIA